MTYNKVHIKGHISHGATHSSGHPYPPACDFHLQANSPAIGAGAASAVSDDFNELARSSTYADIGAFVARAVQ
jgi:hypothetical protein